MPLRLVAGLTAGEIARLVQGVLHGNPDIPVSSIAPLEQASGGALSFIREKSSNRLQDAVCKSGVSVLLSQTAPSFTVPEGKAVIVVADPMDSLIRCIPTFYEAPTGLKGVSPQAAVDPTAKLGREVAIGAFAVIGANCEIGDGAIIHPHAVLYSDVKVGARSIIHSGAIVREDTVIGSNCVVRSGTVIGSEGFGYLPDAQMGLKPVPQVGHVEIADGVEIGANSCIDRATLGVTSVGRGTKIDNLVQVGHNNKLGSFVILCGQVGLAGSCDIGDQAVLGGAVGVGDHVKIASGVRLAGRAGVTYDILEKGDYAGWPAVPVQRWHRVTALLQRLPELLKRQPGEDQDS